MGLSFIPYLLAPYEQIYSACFFYFTCSRNYEQIFSYILYITFQQICQEEIFRAPICNFPAAFGGKQQHSEAKRSFASSPGCKPGGDGGRAAPHFSFLFSVFLFIFNKNISSEIPDTSYEQEHHVPARCILSHILTKAV